MHHSTQLTGRTRTGLALFTLSFFLFCLVIGATCYELVALIPNWAGGTRTELEAFRGFFRFRHPGHFFRSIMPLVLLTLLSSALLLRGRPEGAGKRLLWVLAAVLVPELFTVGYFIPRNFVLFLNPLNNVSDANLVQTAKEWQVANWIRAVLLFGVAGIYLRTALFLARARFSAPAVAATTKTSTRATAVA
ncbi:MAG: DUF1772 domain-containing protein [Chitinophagaceae bacterium]|nr:MAG: DUF1772 domain-containing protein [Chitinophagaceae bacterium]